jgi:hypothetical protein
MNILNDWKIVHAKAPDDGRYVACIEGKVASTNPRFPGSSVIRTSYVISYEMHDGAMLVVTARRSEYLLGKRHPGEYLSEDFLKSFLSERVNEPALGFDAECSQIIAYAEDEYEAPELLTGTPSGLAGRASASPK